MLEGAIETYSNQITLPGSAGGSVTVSRCDGCKGRSLYINAGTKFFIGSKEVTLREMSTYLRSGQRQPTAIFYTLNDGNVRRVAAGK
jgi:DNA replicative helicase MCM subunit Mcm2 (Cdc46/Mcm family)